MEQAATKHAYWAFLEEMTAKAADFDIIHKQIVIRCWFERVGSDYNIREIRSLAAEAALALIASQPDIETRAQLLAAVLGQTESTAFFEAKPFKELAALTLETAQQVRAETACELVRRIFRLGWRVVYGNGGMRLARSLFNAKPMKSLFAMLPETGRNEAAQLVIERITDGDVPEPYASHLSAQRQSEATRSLDRLRDSLYVEDNIPGDEKAIATHLEKAIPGKAPLTDEAFDALLDTLDQAIRRLRDSDENEDAAYRKLIDRYAKKTDTLEREIILRISGALDSGTDEELVFAQKMLEESGLEAPRARRMLAFKNQWKPADILIPIIDTIPDGETKTDLIIEIIKARLPMTICGDYAPPPGKQSLTIYLNTAPEHDTIRQLLNRLEHGSGPYKLALFHLAVRFKDYRQVEALLTPARDYLRQIGQEAEIERILFSDYECIALAAPLMTEDPEFGPFRLDVLGFIDFIARASSAPDPSVLESLEPAALYPVPRYNAFNPAVPLPLSSLEQQIAEKLVRYCYRKSEFSWTGIAFAHIGKAHFAAMLDLVAQADVTEAARQKLYLLVLELGAHHYVSNGDEDELKDNER